MGAAVNLEPALRAGDALGGHLVSGHIDGVARVSAVSDDARSRRADHRGACRAHALPGAKGSVTVDGVSLTVNEVDGASFGVNIIPHTLANTTLGALSSGARVNLEVDQLARYIERLLRGGDAAFGARRRVSSGSGSAPRRRSRADRSSGNRRTSGCCRSADDGWRR